MTSIRGRVAPAGAAAHGGACAGLPAAGRRRRSNAARVSTDATRHTGENEVPKAEVIDGWRDRLSVPEHLLRTDAVPLGGLVEIRYDG
jgi:hypothetical protein